MAFTISQMVGGTKADGAKELSARGFKIFVLNPVTPCRKDVDSCLLMSTGGQSGDDYGQLEDAC